MTGSDPVQVGLHEGELYRDETQIYPIAGNRYFLPVSGFTMKFHRQNMNVDSIVKIYDDGSERVLQTYDGQAFRYGFTGRVADDSRSE